MLPVEPRPEPASFDRAVRRKGLAWIARKNLDPMLPAPTRTKVPAYWSASSEQLWTAYSGICGYSAIYIHQVTGSTTVEHFAPKSLRLDLAFEWSNYRLACSRLNSRKREFQDVLDPFLIRPETFLLELVTGKVSPNPSHDEETRNAVLDTIARLKLNDQFFMDSRVGDFDRYLAKDWSERELRRVSPFVWYEAQRQGYL